MLASKAQQHSRLVSAVSDRPLNQEMLDGFRDGYDINCPEPSANRSASYRHGFAAGRADKGVTPPWGWDIAKARALADLAMEEDERR